MSVVVDNITLKSMETIKCVFELVHEDCVSETVEIRPHIELNIEQNTENANEYRITMGVSIGTKDDSRFPYHVETVLRSVFVFKDIPEEQHPDVIRLNCCSVMFPYVRASLSSIMTCAGVDPYYMPIMNMDKLFSKENLWGGSEIGDK